MLDRLNHLRNLITASHLDGVLLSSPSHIAYLTDYLGFSQLEREAFLLVTGKSVFLITDARYTTTFQKQKSLTILERSQEKSTTSLLTEVVNNEDLQKIGFEADNLTVAEYTEFKKTPSTLVPFSPRELRIIKTPKERELIHQAARKALLSYERTKAMIKPGITEREVVHLIELEMKKMQVEPSFPTIVAFSENAAIPHHLPGNKKLLKNDVVLIDFGVRFFGYCSDITRTFFIGNVPKKWQKIYEIVLTSQEQAVSFIQSSLAHGKEVKAADVDSIARNVIREHGFPSIPHALGHGIGLVVHEAPTLSPTSDDKLSEGMVFSIEPGIYLPGEMGVRIEDLFTIEKNKLVRLS